MNMEPLHIQRPGRKAPPSAITLDQEKIQALDIATALHYSDATKEKIRAATTIPSVDRALVTARLNGEYFP